MTDQEALLIVGFLFFMAAVSLWFNTRHPAPPFLYDIEGNCIVHPLYTPQHYLEDIRDHLWQCNKGMSPDQRAALKSVPIIYKALSQQPWEVSQRRMAQLLATVEGKEVQEVYGFHMGATDKSGYEDRPGAKELFVFGCDHLHNQEEMAKTLVHELGHVISREGHNEAWAQNVRMLGLFETAYGAGNKPKVLPDYRTAPEKLSGPWVDKELAAYIAGMPCVDWGDMDEDAAECMAQALAKMEAKASRTDK